MSTIRQQIIDRIIARLTTIHTTAGYNTDLGANVEHFRSMPWKVESLPACNVKDLQNKISPETTKLQSNELAIDLEISPAAGQVTNIYPIIQDIYTALALEDTKPKALGALADRITQLGEDPELDQAENIITRVTIHLEVEYTAARWTF